MIKLGSLHFTVFTLHTMHKSTIFSIHILSIKASRSYTRNYNVGTQIYTQTYLWKKEMKFIPIKLGPDWWKNGGKEYREKYWRYWNDQIW